MASAATLGRTTAMLALPVLFVLLGYSHAKRFTWAAHLWLGVALGLAPGGAWLAVGAACSEPGIVALMVAVATWVGGFDTSSTACRTSSSTAGRACARSPRASAPGARAIARGLHLVTVTLLAASARLLGGHAAHALAVVLVAALLVYEHSLVTERADGSVDLSRIDQALRRERVGLARLRRAGRD